MTDAQKKYIENNKLLIAQNRWDEFFNQTELKGIGGVLYEAGINFLDKITYVPVKAFYDCSDLTNITIPNTVTSIKDRAFSSCDNLTSITIPNSVVSIEDGVFSCCYSLPSITIPSSVTSIGNWTFAYCWSLTSITIPDSVTSIGHDAFYDCKSLMSVNISKNVMSIGDEAFSECSENTMKINYDGTIDEWKQLISKTNRVFKNTVYTCNCTDGVIKKSR